MNNREKEYFELIASSVHSLLKAISILFEENGIEGMKKLVDPSIEDLRLVLTAMRTQSTELENLIQEKEGENPAIALIVLQNIKQKILSAEMLLIGVEFHDLERCEEAQEGLKKNSNLHPNWLPNKKGDEND